ncbi:MAG: hypothetical protein JW929_11135 [Anaerolineales bacterium]|nr:hypothetical protein [Anaerolineales bacterium]
MLRPSTGSACACKQRPNGTWVKIEPPTLIPPISQIPGGVRIGSFRELGFSFAIPSVTGSKPRTMPDGRPPTGWIQRICAPTGGAGLRNIIAEKIAILSAWVLERIQATALRLVSKMIRRFLMAATAVRKPP